MRQHVTGKLKIEDLKSTLTRICLDSDSEYRRTMIEALENFRGNIRERKRSSGNRIESFIDAVTSNKSILLRRNRESKRLLPQKPFDSVEELYLKKQKRCGTSVENVAVGPSFKILESVSDDVPVKMNHVDQATDPLYTCDSLELIKRELEEVECLEKLQDISKHIDVLLKSKSDVDVKTTMTCDGFVEVVAVEKQAEILYFHDAPIEEVINDESDDGREEFVEAEECALKEAKSLTVIKKKLNKTKENSCLLS